MNERCASVSRKTKETEIQIKLRIDGTGTSKIDTGVGFFNHMLEGFAKHGFFDLEVSVKGDLQVDSHHTIEDTGIVLGQAFKEALGNKEGIRRYGYFILPMDDALVLCSLDISGRHFFSYDCDLTIDKLGNMETEMIKEFFYAFSSGLGTNLHIKKLDGTNNHHIIEAEFKAFAKALDMAVGLDQRIEGVLSTKGSL